MELLAQVKEQADRSAAKLYIRDVRLDERGEPCAELDVTGDRFTVTLKAARGKEQAELRQYVDRQIKQAMALGGSKHRPVSTLETAERLWPNNKEIKEVRIADRHEYHLPQPAYFSLYVASRAGRRSSALGAGRHLRLAAGDFSAHQEARSR